MEHDAPASLKTFLVTLRITVDPSQCDNPAEWDWATLLDMDATDATECVGVQDVTHTTDNPTT